MNGPQKVEAMRPRAEGAPQASKLPPGRVTLGGYTKEEIKVHFRSELEREEQEDEISWG